MAELSQELLQNLQNLTQDQFNLFKWYLKLVGFTEEQLEKADRKRTVDLMMEKYRGSGALQKTMEFLEKMCRNDLVACLQKYQVSDFRF